MFFFLGLEKLLFKITVFLTKSIINLSGLDTQVSQKISMQDSGINEKVMENIRM